MALTVSLRVVGVFCYLKDVSLPQLSPQSTVQEVMDAIAAKIPAFTYESGEVAGHKLLVDRIQYTYYGAGHMMYIRDEDRHKLSEDVRAFIRGR